MQLHREHALQVEQQAMREEEADQDDLDDYQPLGGVSSSTKCRHSLLYVLPTGIDFPVKEGWVGWGENWDRSMNYSCFGTGNPLTIFPPKK